MLRELLALVPDELLGDGPAAARDRYLDYLAARLAEPREFVDEAVAARERRLAETPTPFGARR